VTLQPHLADQIGQLADPPQSILDREHRLVGADEWIPNLDGEGACLSLVRVSHYFE
jgi:hypothetical protein